MTITGSPSMTLQAINSQPCEDNEKEAIVVRWCEHVSRLKSVFRELLQGTIQKRTRGRPRKVWLDNTKDGTRVSFDALLNPTQDRTQWRRMMAEASAILRRAYPPSDQTSEARTRINQLTHAHARAHTHGHTHAHIPNWMKTIVGIFRSIYEIALGSFHVYSAMELHVL